MKGFLSYWKFVIIGRRMLLPIIFAGGQGISWYAILPLTILLFATSSDLFVKILLSIIIICGLSIIYFPILLLLLWSKYKKQQIPHKILEDANFFEKVKYISGEISWL